MTSILQSFLHLAKIKFTKTYLNQLALVHPNKNNMLGLKQMLDVYGIKTEGVKYEDKLLAELVFPCILHISGGFVANRQPLFCYRAKLCVQSQGRNHKTDR